MVPPPALSVPTLDGFQKDAIRMIAAATARTRISEHLSEVRGWGTDVEIEANLFSIFRKQEEVAIAELQRLHTEVSKNIRRLIYLKFHAPKPYDRCLALLDGSLTLAVGDGFILAEIPVLHPIRLDEHKAGLDPDFHGIPSGATVNDFLKFEERGDGGMFRATLQAPVVIKSKNLISTGGTPWWEHSIGPLRIGKIHIFFRKALEYVLRAEDCSTSEIKLISFMREHPNHPLRRHLPPEFFRIMQARERFDQGMRAYKRAEELGDQLGKILESAKVGDHISADSHRIAYELRRELKAVMASKIGLTPGYAEHVLLKYEGVAK